LPATARYFFLPLGIVMIVGAIFSFFMARKYAKLSRTLS
jgi:ABC-type antimicrobial peptide transport system permease subunit